VTNRPVDGIQISTTQKEEEEHSERGSIRNEESKAMQVNEELNSSAVRSVEEGESGIIIAIRIDNQTTRTASWITSKICTHLHLLAIQEDNLEYVSFIL